MSRIRSIKPEAFTSPHLADIPIPARWYFTGLWTEADDTGRLVFQPAGLAAVLFPYDDEVDARLICEWSSILAAVGLVDLYVVGRRVFLAITGWHHQKIDRPSAARTPSLEDSHVRLRYVDPRVVRLVASGKIEEATKWDHADRTLLDTHATTTIAPSHSLETPRPAPALAAAPKKPSKRRAEPVADDTFDEWWRSYLVLVRGRSTPAGSKQEALRQWSKMTAGMQAEATEGFEAFRRMVAALDAARTDGSTYTIPHGVRYLRNFLWQDAAEQMEAVGADPMKLDDYVEECGECGQRLDRHVESLHDQVIDARSYQDDD